MTLSSTTNSYTGSTSVTAGTISLTGSLTGGTAISTTGTGIISESATGVISGAASLTQGSSGTSVLSGSNSYSGATSVTAGTLTLSGTGAINGSSGITISGSGAKFLQTSSVAGTSGVTLTQGTLTGSGTVGAVNVANTINAIISNNNGVAGASLTTGDLTFNGAATVNTYSNSTSAPLVAGALSSNAAGTVTINPTATTWTSGSTYDLISYTGGSIGGAGLGQFALGTVTGLNSRQSVSTLTNSGTAITLAISGFDTIWTGTLSTEWSTNVLSNPKNWTLSGGGGITDFITGDAVIFNDSATNKTVDISNGNVAPSIVTFTNTTGNDYTLTGTNGITGTNSLLKSGSGMVTLNNTNSYTGGTTVTAGTLVLGQVTDTLANTGAVTVDGATAVLSIGTNSDTVGVVSLKNGASITGSSGVLTGSSYAVESGSISAIFGGVGIALSKTTGGTVTLSGANTYTGTTTISAGTLQLSGTGRPGAAGSSVAVSSGALLDLNGTNQLIAFTGTGSGTVANNSGSGTSSLTLSAAPAGLSIVIKDSTTVAGGNVAVVIAINTQNQDVTNSYTGGTTVNGGAFLYLATGNGAGTGTINLAASNSGLLGNGGATFTNDITGAGYVSNNTNGAGTITLTGNLSNTGIFTFRNAGNVYNFSGSGTSTLSGSIGTLGGTNGIASTGSIIKSGTGTLTLSGASIYTGTTTINGGILSINTIQDVSNATATALGKPITTANGTIAVADTGTLQYTGTGNSSNRVIKLSTLAGGTMTLDASGPSGTFALTGGVTSAGTSGISTLALIGSGLGSESGVIVDGTSPNVTAVRKFGSGTWVLSGANSFTSGTTVNSGTLSSAVAGGFGAGNILINPTGTAGNANDAATLNTNGSIASTADVTVNTNTVTAIGTLNFNGTTPSINTLSGSGSVVLNNAAGTALSIGGSSGTSTFSGVISESTLGAGSLIKNGTGSLTLNGISTYTGATTINAGDLRGTGTLSSLVSATNNAASASLWPGVATIPSQMPNSASETFNVAGVDLSSATANAGGKLKCVIGNGSCQALNVTAGVCNLANATLSLSVNSGTSSYPIIQSSTITGTFSTVIVNGISYPFTSSTSVNSSSTPDQVAQIDPTHSVTISYSVANGTFVTVNVSGGVTPVKLDAFQATARGAGVDVSWIAVSEFKNAGFNVYRRSIGTSDWTRCNSALISGRITNADEKQYSFYDWATAGTYEYKLESVGLNDEREAFFPEGGAVIVDWNTELTNNENVTQDTVGAALNSIMLDASVSQASEVTARVIAVSSGRMPNAQVRSFAIAGSPTRALAVSTKPSALSATNATAGVRWFTSGTPASSASASSYSVAKLVYVSSGVMLIPQASMPAGYDLNHVTLQREGRYFPALAITPAGLLVYLPGYADDYTNKDAVFLRRIAGKTADSSTTPATGLFTSNLQPNVTSAATVSADYHDVYFDYDYRPYNFAPWFSAQYLTQGTTQNFMLNTPLPTSGTATITINLWSLTDSATVNPDHGLTVSVNNVLCGTQNWDGGNKMLQFKFTVPASALTNGANTISLTTPTIAGQDSQIAFLHSMSVDYTRLLDASQALSVTNSTDAAQMYELYNVPAAGAYVVDIRFADHAALVATQTVAQPDGTQHMRFIAANGGTGRFLIVPVGQETSALTITARQVKALRLSGTYLATGPAQFASGIQPLLTARAKEGVRGSFADQEALFDYYNYGRYGPDGIRKAVRSVHPTYLLLLGRTTYDYRNFSGLNIDPLCPAFLVSTSFWAQTTSDSAFGDLGRGYSEVSVGRLPIGSTTDLATAVNRILVYKGLPSTGSGVRVHGVADRPDPDAGDFAAQLATLQAAHPDLTWQTNDLGVTYQTAGEVHNAMSDAANGGADLIMYAGHGNASRLGKVDPRILDDNTISDWKGNVVFIQATCTANWDANNAIGYKSIAMKALTQPNGGISASIASSTYMNSDVAIDFMNQLLKNAAASTNARWGTVLMKTQQWAAQKGGANSFYSDMSSAEQIFGDPAMRIYAAPARTTVTGSGASNSGTQTGSF